MQEIFKVATNPRIKLSKSNKEKEKWYKKWWGVLLLSFGAALLVFFLIFLGLTFYYYRQIKSGKMPLPASAKFLRASAPTAESKQVDPKKVLPDGEPNSSPNALLTVVGFFDFQCPFSKEASATVRELQSIYGDKVNFVFRNFPLTDIHPQAMLAAQAGECAHEQNKFWPMHDKIFLNSAATEEDLKSYAKQIGLDEKKFSDCLASSKSRGQVLKDYLDGQLLGIRGTPTWFINNEKIEGTISTDIFKKLIDYLLTEQK